ncbi:alpha/beta hydrolase-fold protein [Xenorhabdus miraniensis]|uniref:Enterochelin esterase-like protein n=1 Tax=Xenorhabdus miraniensis TaxID=351674 RepID=A0A2D0JL80_9GAMM|nr:alpha/beta hydrolase-fold protein [Xenorhabdus miraniensis]PHM47062.1 enterochelin esterase-like protein [Xenorhabdus miraniensis]
MKSLPLIGAMLISTLAIASEPDCMQTIAQNPLIEGIHDKEGKSCLTIQFSDQQYIQLKGQGFSSIILSDADNQPYRVLLERVPVQEAQSVSYIVPITEQYHLQLQGEPEQGWQISFDIQDYQPLAIQVEDELISPKLQQLKKTIEEGGSTTHFWNEISTIGTPLVEPHSEKQMKVTFLWRGAKSNVYILGAPSGNHEVMSHLPGSDVWYRTFITPDDTLMQYKIAPDVPKIAQDGIAQRKAILTTAQADPLNHFPSPTSRRDKYNHFSLLSLTPQQRQCHFREIENYHRKGRLESFRLESKVMGNSREIAVLHPATETPTPAMLVLLDGQIYLHTYQMADFFDNWISAGKMPAMYIVFVDSISPKLRRKELPPNEHFPQFLAEELMPALAATGITVPAGRTIIAGSSYGGLASTWNALQHPELFGNVLSMSGSYWWAPEGEEHEWLLRKMATMEKKPIRFYLEAGLFEKRGSWGGIIQNHYRLSELLTQKGYPLETRELPSGHDYVSWCETLYDGIRSLSSHW